MSPLRVNERLWHFYLPPNDFLNKSQLAFAPFPTFRRENRNRLKKVGKNPRNVSVFPSILGLSKTFHGFVDAMPPLWKFYAIFFDRHADRSMLILVSLDGSPGPGSGPQLGQA